MDFGVHLNVAGGIPDRGIPAIWLGVHQIGHLGVYRTGVYRLFWRGIPARGIPDRGIPAR